MPPTDSYLPAPEDNLRDRGISGTVLIGLSQGLKFVIQVASVLTLARLLNAEAFGLFAMVTPVVNLAILVGDLGLNQAVITSRLLRHSEASTLFWLNLVIAGALAGMLVLLSSLLAWFYGQAQVQEIAIALAAAVLLSGFGTLHLALLNRYMRFSQLAALEVAASLLGFLATVAIASINPTVWALVASPIVSAAILALASWYLTGWLPSRPGRLGEVLPMLRFGAGVTTFNLTNFVARNADNVLIGRAAGAEALGHYDRAYKLLLMPLEQITRPAGRAMLPVLSRLTNEPDRYRHAYMRAIRQIMLISLPGLVFLMIEAKSLIPLLLGPGWEASATIFGWLALSGLHQPMTTTVGWLFVSQSRTGEYARWGLINGSFTLAAFLIGIFWLGGALGVAQAYVLTDTFILMPLLYYLVGRRGPVTTRNLFQAGLEHAFAGAAAAAAIILWSNANLCGRFVHLGTSILLSYAVGTLAILLFAGGRDAVAESVTLAGHCWRKFWKLVK